VAGILGQGSRPLDKKIIELMQYRSKPCHHRWRRVPVFYGSTWRSYMADVLASRKLSAREICAFYRVK
jgi:hypothetical protein